MTDDYPLGADSDTDAIREAWENVAVAILRHAEGMRRVAAAFEKLSTDFPAHGGVAGAAMSDLGQILGSNEPEVCVTHGRFRPCRIRHLCRYTSDPMAVAAVRDYQNGKISTWEAETWR